MILKHVYALFAREIFYHQPFCLVLEVKQFSLQILFFQFLNQHHPFCIHVLLTTVLVAQDGY